MECRLISLDFRWKIELYLDQLYLLVCQGYHSHLKHIEYLANLVRMRLKKDEIPSGAFLMSSVTCFWMT